MTMIYHVVLPHHSKPASYTVSAHTVSDAPDKQDLLMISLNDSTSSTQILVPRGLVDRLTQMMCEARDTLNNRPAETDC